MNERMRYFLNKELHISICLPNTSGVINWGGVSWTMQLVRNKGQQYAHSSFSTSALCRASLNSCRRTRPCLVLKLLSALKKSPKHKHNILAGHKFLVLEHFI